MASSPRPVNLHLASSYIPICVYCLVLMCMLFVAYNFRANLVDTWVFLTVLTYTGRRVYRGQIFDGNTILECICLSTLLNLFRVERGDLVVMHSLVSYLWVIQAVVSNILISWQAKPTENEALCWGIYAFCLFSTSQVAPSENEISELATFLRPVLFFISSTAWVYIMEVEKLSYDTVCSFNNTQIRFSCMLYIHPLGCITVFLAGFVYIGYTVYDSKHVTAPVTVLSALEDASPQVSEIMEEDDAAIFRLALSSSGLKQN